MNIETEFLERCIAKLARAYDLIQKVKHEDIEYNIYAAVCDEEFENILAQSGKLLKKVLKPYFSSSKSVDQLYFKDIFRHASHHGLFDAEACERWLAYRDNRNNTSHDYGVNFAQETILLLPGFIEDASHLATAIKASNTY